MKIELKFIKFKFNFPCKVEQKFAEDTSHFTCMIMRNEPQTNLELYSYWLDFILPEQAIQVANGEYTSIVLLNSEP